MHKWALFCTLCTAACGSTQTAKTEPIAEVEEEDDGLDYDPEALVDFDVFWDGKEHIGARYRIAEDWHLYWINPGDSGLPTKVSFEGLPEGVTIDGPAYPGPVRFGSEGDIVNYGYHGVLVLPLTMSGTLPEGTTGLTAKASWLACRDDACVPGKTEATLDLAASADADALDALSASRSQLPKSPDEIGESIAIERGIPKEDGAVEVLVHAPASSALEVFPLIDEALSEVSTGSVEKHAELRFTLRPVADESGLAVLSVKDPSGSHFYLFDNDWLSPGQPQ